MGVGSTAPAFGTPSPKDLKYIDAFHSQLLIDVQEISDVIDKHSKALPAAYIEFDTKAENIASVAAKATKDFEAMGLALVGVIKSRTDAMRTETIATHLEVAKTTQKSLEQFTRYFWLVIGMTAFNFMLLVALLGLFFVTQASR